MNKIKRAQIFSDTLIIILAVLGLVLIVWNYIPTTYTVADKIHSVIVQIACVIPSLILSFMVGYMDYTIYNRTAFLIVCPAVTLLLCICDFTLIEPIISEGVATVLSLIFSVQIDGLIQDLKKANKALNGEEEKETATAIFEKKPNRIKTLSFILIGVLIILTVILTIASISNSEYGTAVQWVFLLSLIVLYASPAIISAGIFGYISDAEKPQRNSAKLYATVTTILCAISAAVSASIVMIILSSIFSLFLIVSMTEILEKREELYQALQEKNKE